VKCYFSSITLYGAENWTLQTVDQKYLGIFEISCWRRMEKTICTDHVKNEEVEQRVNEGRYDLHTIKKKAKWIGHILCRSCLLKHIAERKIGGDRSERKTRKKI
jgi:hypothetical protein